MPPGVMASIRRTSPLARPRPGSPASDVVVVVAADDQVTGGGLRAFGYRHGPAAVDQAEMDQVAADPPGQFPAACPLRGCQDHVMAGQVAGDVGLDGLVHGLIGRGAADPAVLVVVIERGLVPGAQPQRGVPFPLGGEPDRLGQLHIPEPVGEQHHRAAALDGRELLLIPGEHHLAAVRRGVADERREVLQGDHGALIGQDQRARRDPAAPDGWPAAGSCWPSPARRPCAAR